MGKTHSKPLAAWHGRGTAWARHAMCESAFSLSFMQKTMQKLVTKNIKDGTLGHDTYIYSNLPTNQLSTQKPQCTM
jgi:hypothetical protein